MAVMPLRDEPYTVEHGRVQQETVFANSEDEGEITYEMELVSEHNYKIGQKIIIDGQMFKIFDDHGKCGGEDAGKYAHLLETV